MSKYISLTAHLDAHKGPEWRATFAQLEAVLGFALPKAAHTARAWWHNTGAQPHQRAWIGPGWEVAEVDPAQGLVTFRRKTLAEPANPGPDSAPGLNEEPAILQRLDASPKWGAALMLGSVALVAGLGALMFARRRRP